MTTSRPRPADSSELDRDSIAQDYFDVLPFPPYPVQEDALLAWFTSSQGVLVCAPTGTGKTLIAEAAIYEALRLGRRAYYTTPLVALTEQKFDEICAAAERWGFSRADIGLVTGNRRINPAAPILVVVAEILLNRLLHREAFSFDDVWAVVMDEFHSFNDPERGIVWEFGLALLPPSVRTLLLSATVGNALEFAGWLAKRHGRDLILVESTDRRIPLTFQWIDDRLLDEQLEAMFVGDEAERLTPALVFCFNREQCWTTAEMLKGKRLVHPDQQRQLGQFLEEYDWSQGAGPKLKQILIRGIGVHHAGVLPKYRRLVEQLFQLKLLSVCVCTETLAAGINLPARSVVLPTLMKGPPGKMKLIEPAAAHQMFGRAGRPQFDHRGLVFALAHEDDVKIGRWQQRLDQIPESTKDPALLRARKDLKRKMPRRREGVQYWSEGQFQHLVQSKPAPLASAGPLPWRLLAYMLDISPEVEPIRQLVDKRLFKGRAMERAHDQLDDMLLVLDRAGYVQLEPRPHAPPDDQAANVRIASAAEPPVTEQPAYRARLATPTERLGDLLRLRGIHPLYGVYLVNQLGIASRAERIEAMESALELPRSLGRAVWPPPLDVMPPGPLATGRLDPLLLQLGLATAEELGALPTEELDDEPRRGWFDDQPPPVLTLAHKLERLFQFDFPGVHDLRLMPAWVAGELLEFGGEFNKYITSKQLQKQEGVIFRHLLRLILLIDELAQLQPADTTREEWQDDLGDIAERIEASCREVDPRSTEQFLEETRRQDELE